MNVRSLAESLFITLVALIASLALFGAFMLCYERISPLELYSLMYKGSFGSQFSRQYALTNAAPLILTALCTALPARLGLVIIGGEGTLAIGGLAAAGTGLLLQSLPPVANQIGMALASMVAGGLCIAFVGMLGHWRGVNATISSLLLNYIAIAIFSYLVEGPMRDPASLNKPSTYPLPESVLLGKMFGSNVHMGLAFGVIACLLLYVLMDHSIFGFAARMAGGNMRTAQAAGLPVGRLILVTCFFGGAAAGLAGMVEVAAVHHQANASMLVGYGYTGILVSFIARHHPLAIIPAAVLFGGLTASSTMIERYLKVPNAAAPLLMGIMFVMILLCETLYGRFRIFQPREIKEAPAAS